MATDLSKQHILDADPRAMKQKKGTKNNTHLLFQKTIFDFWVIPCQIIR